MQHPDEGTIHAWIDGELSPEDAAALEAHLAECQECSALAAEARGLVAASSRIVSALDIIPGDVIPKAQPRRRPWYASTQLRAAAAVVIVAGASLLVARNDGVKKMERAVETSAPAEVATPAAQPAPDTASSEIASASVPAPVHANAPAPPKDAREKALEGKVAGVRDLELRKEAANDAIKIAAAPPPAPAAQSSGAHVMADEIASLKAAAARDSARDSLALRRRFGATTTLNEVVVTGVATSSAPMQMKKLRADSAGNVTVYEVSPGVEVTLTDNGRQASAMLRASAQAKEKQMAAQAPPPPAVPAPKPLLNSISWTDKRGHMMVLTGPFSREALEGLRQRLPADQR